MISCAALVLAGSVVLLKAVVPFAWLAAQVAVAVKSVEPQVETELVTVPGCCLHGSHGIFLLNDIHSIYIL